MRLGYILKSFPRLSETFILTEILELERLGCEVTIFSRWAPIEPVPHQALASLRAEVLDMEPLLRERFWEPFEIHRRLARLGGAVHAASLDAALRLRAREEMRWWLQAGFVAEQAVERRLELLHGHFATGSASVARYASMITGVPFSFTAHAKDIYSSAVDPNRLRELLREARTVITVSDSNRDFLGNLQPEARVERVYNGVDLQRFPFLSPERTAVRPPVLLFVGRLVEKKGIMDLLAALASLREAGIPARCRIVGSGPMELDLRQQSGALGLDGQVEFCGPASQEEIASVHLPAASVAVLPCVIAADGDRDVLPTMLLEAMARGVPVVSTRLPGIVEAVPDGVAGLLADPGDARSLAASIAETLRDREAAARRAREARRRVERLFNSRLNAQRLLAVFSAAVAPARAEAHL